MKQEKGESKPIYQREKNKSNTKEVVLRRIGIRKGPKSLPL